MTFGTTYQLAPYSDRTSATFGHLRFHPYHTDLEPDSYYHHHSNHIPRPLSTIALRLQDPRLRCKRQLGWSIDWAVAFIVDFLETKNSPDAPDVLRNIRIRAANLENEGLSKEIPYRVFHKLDETLFAGHLKNAVFLEKRNLGPDVSGATHAHGWGLNAKVKRISVILNQEVLQYARSRDIIAALIHHMIHAYFLVACGFQKEEEIPYGRLGHGLHFGKIMMTIKKLFTVHGNPLTSLDFGHYLGHSHTYCSDEHYYPRRSSSCLRRRKEKWYRSHCYSDVEGIPESEIEEWYGWTCKPLFSLPETVRSATVQIYNDRWHQLEEIHRARTSPSIDSNEFLFRDKPILVPSAKIDAFFSIRMAFDKAKSRYLEIHEEVSEETFMRFLELVHTGTYGPDPKPIFAMGGKGPPIIKPSSPSSLPYLLTDVRIFKMGCLMGFDELKGIALDRMYRHSNTHEDPISILKEVYAGGEPDPDLKTWVRKFLITPVGDGEWMGGARSINNVIDPPNLIKLESPQLTYSAGFFDAVDASGGLENDVKKAREMLVRVGYRPPPTWGVFADPRVALDMSPSVSPPLGIGMGLGMPSRGLPWMTPEDLDGIYGRSLGLGDGFKDPMWPYC